MSSYKITTDLFTLPYKRGQSVLYAPLLGFACVANDELVNFLSKIESIQNGTITSEEQKILDFLISKDLINGAPLFAPIQNFNEALTHDKLTLFPTNGCSLNCRYCYAADEHFAPKTMAWDVAINAIEYYIDFMRKNNKQLFQLELHGGGEPFSAWTLVQRIINYTEERCLDEGFDLEIQSSTNGLLKDSQLNWIVEHFTSISVSFDGLPRVQNFHRSTMKNSSSFDFVNRTLKFFDKHNFHYGIRCSVSSFNEDLLDETVEFVSKNYKTKLLYLEPVYVCGGCVPNAENLKPNLYKFIDNFKRLEPICAEKDIRLEYSGAQFEKITPTFCYVGSDNFAVTPDGYLTNCWEVTSKSHPLADYFIFGQVLPGGKISIDADKLKYLRSLSVNNLEYCRNCFAKWHCAGDCVTRLGHQNFKGDRGGDRCETNRQIIAHRVFQMLERENFYQAV